MDRSILKNNAKNHLRKNYANCVVVTILIMLCAQNGVLVSYISMIPTMLLRDQTRELNALITNPETSYIFRSYWLLLIFTSVYIFVGLIIFSSFKCGGIRYFLKLRKNQPVEFSEIFLHFKDKTFVNIAKISVIREIKIALWYIALIIPGFIKSFEYWAIDYILAVRPDIDSKEAFRLSKAIMDGSKWDLFVLHLSFWGWSILAGFSGALLGILFVFPYMQLTYVEFFSELRLKAIAEGKITENDVPDYDYVDSQMQYQQQVYQQPKNIVYGADGIPLNNTMYTQPPVQRPKNIVYRPDGMQMGGNMNYTQQPFTPPTYQQTWNNPYAPQQPVVEHSTDEDVNE